MIELSATTAFMVYLGLTLAVLLGLWIYQHYSTKNKTIVPAEQELSICEFCHFAYLKDSVKAVSKCPQCRSFNSKRS